MGQTDELAMKARPSGYMYTPITRGHKPTPSQESNTLSEASCTTDISVESASPSHKAEHTSSSSRLSEFEDEVVNNDLSVDGRLSRSTSVSSNCDCDKVEERQLSESSGNNRWRGGARGRGCARCHHRDTVIHICREGCETCGGKIATTEMNRETNKSQNSDYGSFCVTPTEAGARTTVAGTGPSSGATRMGPDAPRGPAGSTSSLPHQPLQNKRTRDQDDHSVMSGDQYQKTPLLRDSESDDEDLILPDPDGRGDVVKVEIPSQHPALPLEYPKEPLKTLLAAVFLVFGWVATTASLALTHERVPDIDPLPDIVLDNVQYQQWGLDASEILIMVSTITAVLVVLLHAHRWIILRRIWLLLGLLYYYRAITMYVTVLPKADTTYTCVPKQNTTTAYVIAERVLKIISGGGLSINGKHVYCGDYIFSGHTMVLTMGYYAIREYSPRRFFLLHWLSLCTSVAGVILLLLARGHYSIDVVIAYWITSRLWWLYHTLAHNQSLKRRGKHNFLSEIWWWVIFRYFENKIPGPLPRQYSLPIPDFVLNLLCRKKPTDELDSVSQASVDRSSTQQVAISIQP